jgi:hypothetical protein
MKIEHAADVGDLIVIAGHHVGESGADRRDPRGRASHRMSVGRVRWDDGHESVYYPEATRRSSTRRTGAPCKGAASTNADLEKWTYCSRSNAARGHLATRALREVERTPVVRAPLRDPVDRDVLWRPGATVREGVEAVTWRADERRSSPERHRHPPRSSARGRPGRSARPSRGACGGLARGPQGSRFLAERRQPTCVPVIDFASESKSISRSSRSTSMPSSSENRPPSVATM